MRHALLLCACLMLSLRPLPAAAQAADSMAPFIAVSVADLDRVHRWYIDVLGFTEQSRGKLPAHGIRYALLRRGAALVELIERADASAPDAATRELQGQARLHGYFKAGFVVADLDAYHQRIKAMGQPLAFALGRPPGGPLRVFGLRDPEGNLLQVFGN